VYVVVGTSIIKMIVVEVGFVRHAIFNGWQISHLHSLTMLAPDLHWPCVAYLQTGALPALLRTVMNPEYDGDAAAAARAAAEGSSPAKIALFTIGNMCAHRETRWVSVCVRASGCTHACSTPDLWPASI
jgi:hypothetical protein